MTVQYIIDGEWRGNISVDRNNCESLGISLEEYDYLITANTELAQALSEKGLSRGGVDIALGTIRTRWGKKDVVAFQDPNLRPNGGEQMRALLDGAKSRFGESIQVASRVIKPVAGYGEINEALTEISQKYGLPEGSIELITSVPPGWGMFGVARDASVEAMLYAIQIEKELAARGLVELNGDGKGLKERGQLLLEKAGKVMSNLGNMMEGFIRV